jgi:hypothetical protein
MGVQTSEVSICNQALSWLGADPITSLDDQSTRAELCKLNYPLLRDAVLEERMWTFATVRDISEVQDKDAWGVMYQHPTPKNWLSVFRVYRDVNQRQNTTSEGWRLEEGNILAQDSKIFLWGVQSVANTHLFTNMFVQCLAARIAADLCVPLTENIQQQEILWSLYGSKLREAASRDGTQGDNDVITQHKLTAVRGGTGLGDGYFYG